MIALRLTGGGAAVRSPRDSIHHPPHRIVGGTGAGRPRGSPGAVLVRYSFDDNASPGNLQYFKSFWIKVLPGAAGKTVELLIPDIASTRAARLAATG